MDRYDNPNLLLDSKEEKQGSITWKSPSNIALVKYWGKYGRQLPSNPSVSLTLQNAHTETRLSYSTKNGEDNEAIRLSFFFDGHPQPEFQKRLQTYLESIRSIFPFLGQLNLRIDSRNSFPHSTGIASSASAMSALALCLCSLEEALFEGEMSQEAFLQKASFIARLGSGSACRSVYPIAAVWGSCEPLPSATQEYAVGIGDHTHPVFSTFHDDILLVSRKKKEVSSTAGHQLMKNHAFADARFQQARSNLEGMLEALKQGDLESFGQTLELEALTLHGLMLSSQPPFILLEPNTLALIRKIRAFRQDTGCPLYFTLDAGPNLHLLYPDEHESPVRAFIDTELKPYCEDGKVIEDVVGQGAVKLN